MSSDGIFLHSGSGLTVLEQRDYDSEALLQVALAQYPEVIAGPATVTEGVARLLLVRREMGVPSVEEGHSNFSLDHLFLDSSGVPVLVEVKRASDTRIRREVIGQMLDYAANGVKYWPVAMLQQSLEQTAADRDRQAEDLLRDLRPDLNPEDFWTAVEANLKAGRIRMLFVADALPSELVRIIEVLNEQMSPAEVLGVELRQYVGGDHTVFVPRVVGRTSEAVVAKAGGARSGQQWGRDSFLMVAQERCSPAEVALMQRLLDDVRDRGARLSWGKGATPGVAGWYSLGGQHTAMWVLNANNENPTTRAYLVFYLGDVVKRIGAARVERAAKILETIPLLAPKIADARLSGWNKYPSLFLSDVAAEPRHEQAVFATITDLLADA